MSWIIIWNTICLLVVTEYCTCETFNTSGDHVDHLPEKYISNYRDMRPEYGHLQLSQYGDAWITLTTMKANISNTYYSIFLGGWSSLEMSIYRHIRGYKTKVATLTPKLTRTGIQYFSIYWTNGYILVNDNDQMITYKDPCPFQILDVGFSSVYNVQWEISWLYTVYWNWECYGLSTGTKTEIQNHVSQQQDVCERNGGIFGECVHCRCCKRVFALEECSQPCLGCRRYAYREDCPAFKLLKSVQTSNEYECVNACGNENNCQSYNYDKTTQTCQLFLGEVDDDADTAPPVFRRISYKADVD